MKAAAIQFRPTFKDKPGNLRRLAQLVVDAAKAGAKLVVLPELCTTGYSFMSAEEARPLAESPSWLDDPDGLNPETSLYVFYTLARKLGICIVYGLVTVELGTGKLHNSQVYLDPDGYYEQYAKINRWGNDFLWSESGRSNPPIIKSSLGVRVGLLICRDVRDKRDDKWSDFYSKGDADVVCLSANWGDGGFPSVSWMEFASDNGCVLVVANRHGQESCNNFGEGGSCVILPDGKVFCEGLEFSRDCIVIADI